MVATQPVDEPIALPDKYTVEWALSLTERLDTASRTGDVASLRRVLPEDVLSQLWQAVTVVLAKEPTLLEVYPHQDAPFGCKTYCRPTLLPHRPACACRHVALGLLQVTPPAGASVTVVGDTHGQFHDVIHPLCAMLQISCFPGTIKAHPVTTHYQNSLPRLPNAAVHVWRILDVCLVEHAAATLNPYTTSQL